MLGPTHRCSRRQKSVDTDPIVARTKAVAQPTPSKALERLRNATQITVLLGEQNIIFALPHAHRVYVLERGRIVWEGGPSQFGIEAGAQYL